MSGSFWWNDKALVNKPAARVAVKLYLDAGTKDDGLAATNFQDNIDKALLREGRFDRKIPIDMPDLKARTEVVEHYLNRVCTGDKNGRLIGRNGKKPV